MKYIVASPIIQVVTYTKIVATSLTLNKHGPNKQQEQLNKDMCFRINYWLCGWIDGG